MPDRHNDDYVFKRHYRASARLDLQHYHWRETVGHLIHPQITLTGENIQVLDIACGTGIWLTEISRNLPSSTVLVGTDTWSIFDEPPDNLIGRFDLVHLRFLGLVIKGSELTSILVRVMKTLKKGGWIQWGEYDHLSNTIVKADSEASSSKFETLLRQGLTRPSWVGGLEDIFRKQELASVQSFRHTPPCDHLPSIMDSILMGFEELIEDKDKESVGELENLLAGAATEASNGIAWTGHRVEVIGRKP